MTNHKLIGPLKTDETKIIYFKFIYIFKKNEVI